MTTIAYRNGVIVGDTLICENGRRCGRATKVFKRGTVLAGGAGCLPSII